MTAPGSEVRLPQVPLLVHFVDRPRGTFLGPPAVRSLSGSQKLSNILLTGYLRGFYVTGASTPIVAASDLSPAELKHAFKDGLNTRGRLPSPVADPHPDVAGTNHPTVTVERWHWNGRGLIHAGSFPIEEGPEDGAQ